MKLVLGLVTIMLILSLPTYSQVEKRGKELKLDQLIEELEASVPDQDIEIRPNCLIKKSPICQLKMKMIESKKDRKDYGHRFKWHQKINPIFWLGNADTTEAPDWYKPGKKFRKLQWYFRNPAHNFTFYVIGLGDKIHKKEFSIVGIHPDHVFSPEKGWNLTYIKYKGLRLPFISFWNEKVKFYFGWRERGNFGVKLTKGMEENPSAPKVISEEEREKRRKARKKARIKARKKEREEAKKLEQKATEKKSQTISESKSI